jgi:hypothetical protein
LRQEHTILLWNRVNALVPIPGPPELAKLPLAEVRPRHVRALWNYFLERGASLGNPPQEVDLEWLRAQLAHHADLEKRCAATYTEYKYGVIYGVRCVEADLDVLEYHTSMGLKALCPILVDRLIAKVRVPATCRVPLRENDYGLKALFEDGVVGRLHLSRRPQDDQ